jgi:hypothetical protein
MTFIADEFMEVLQQVELRIVSNMTFAAPMDTPDQRPRAFL